MAMAVLLPVQWFSPPGAVAAPRPLSRFAFSRITGPTILSSPIPPISIPNNFPIPPPFTFWKSAAAVAVPPPPSSKAWLFQSLSVSTQTTNPNFRQVHRFRLPRAHCYHWLRHPGLAIKICVVISVASFALRFHGISSKILSNFIELTIIFMDEIHFQQKIYKLQSTPLSINALCIRLL